jgi:putative PIN family toxin of toxin-antitoxin system
MKVILDVNVWISALLWRGVPGQILDLADRQEITIFVSDEILQELGETLNKPKLP